MKMIHQHIKRTGLNDNESCYFWAQVLPVEGQLRDFSSVINNILTELAYENLRNHIYQTLRK